MSTSSFPSDYRQWLAKLISFDTTSRNSNLEFIAYVESYLTSLGVSCTRVYNAEKTKANLWATIPGEGGEMQGGIILSGHTDVVPVDGQKWDSDPFTMVEKDGKLYGRGSCDMKGFLAVVLTQTPTFLAMKRVKPIHYAFSYDEEVGCFGAGVLVQFLKAQEFHADCCLVGEPRGHFIGTGNKGHFFWRIVVHGKAIHSSMALMNTSCNAIEYGALIITKIRQIAERVRATEKRDNTYTCPFSPLSVNLVEGGNAVNTVPAECTIEFSVRLMNMEVGKRIEAEIKEYIDTTVLPSMQAEYPEASVEYVVDTSLPPFNADEQNAFTQLARKVMGNTLMHKSGGGTEAGHFQEGLGIPTVINGPAGGGAHEPNEYVEVKNMDLSVAFTTKLVAACTSGTTFVSAAASL